MTLQILHHEFLGPVRLSEWGPPMSEVVYLLLARDGDKFKMLYVDSTDGTKEADFFTKNDKFKCWHEHARGESNLYLAILPVTETTPDPHRIAWQIEAQYDPVCNRGDQS